MTAEGGGPTPTSGHNCSPTCNVAARLTLALALAALPAMAAANTYPGSHVTFHAFDKLMIAWVVVGLVLQLRKPRPDFLGVGMLLMIGPCAMSAVDDWRWWHGSRSLALLVWLWLPYLAILVARYARPGKHADPERRRINLIYHGGFLLGVVVTGAALGLRWRSEVGGTARWLLNARASVWGVGQTLTYAALVVGAWLLIVWVIKRFLLRAAKAASEPEEPPLPEDDEAPTREPAEASTP